jgi:hypothetical protein
MINRSISDTLAWADNRYAEMTAQRNRGNTAFCKLGHADYGRIDALPADQFDAAIMALGADPLIGYDVTGRAHCIGIKQV